MAADGTEGAAPAAPGRERPRRSRTEPSGEEPAGHQGDDPDADPVSVARAVALRQLTMAPRSRAELEQKMATKGVEREVAAQVLDRLTEVGLVDDEAYAGMLVRSRQVTRGLARRGLQQELRSKGVDDDVARAALAEVTDEDERATAEALVARRLRVTRGLDRPVRERRLLGLLARKGYGGGVARAVVREALDADDLTGA